MGRRSASSNIPPYAHQSPTAYLPAMLTFVSPLFLIGLVSAGIPLLIHLSRSRRTKKMQFSTTRFFTDQFLRSYRMSRLKELLLLACRMALCALFALALAGPMLLPRGGTVFSGQSRSVVLVLDQSASMGLEENGETMLDRAKAAAREVLDGLRPGDRASLVLAGRRDRGPEVVFDEPTPQLGDVRQALEQVAVASLGTDLASAVNVARQVLVKATTEGKEIYVLSDLQDSGWSADEPATTLPSDELLFFVRVRPEKPADLAVTAVQYSAARPMVGVPFAIRPHIRNTGDGSRATNVKLWIDGELVAERKLDNLAGGRWTSPRLHHAFAKGGWHEGYVEIDDRALPADDRRYFAFEVVDAVKVLAVDGAPSEITRLDELFFLKTALRAAAGEQSPIEIDVVSPDAVAAAELNKYRVVILANIESLPPTAVEKLESFVDRGGSALMFLGDRTNQPFFNSALAGDTRLHGGLSPGKLVAVEGSPPETRTVAHVGQLDLDHPALAAFDDPQLANLSSVGFTALWTVEPKLDERQQGQVLMRADTGPPLLLEKPFGKGRVMLFASTCDRDWTNFPVRPAYLPWVYRLVGYLAQEPIVKHPFYRTGDEVPLAASALEGVGQVLVRTPDNTIKHAAPSADTDAPLAFDETYTPGTYRVFSPGKEAQAVRFVANLESFESDLTYLDEGTGQTEQGAESTDAEVEAALRELVGDDNLTYVSDPRKIGEVSLAARRGVKLWDIFLAIALVIAVVEPWLANRISARHYGRPREIAPLEQTIPGRKAPAYGRAAELAKR
ncbi:MAG TPA: VWA domain-containing protein [Pirellulales bacterium]|nr:VWA domain-containing protein [Pirellulales bacterium]